MNNIAAELCEAKFKELAGSRFQRHEWTVVAGIVLTRSAQSRSNNHLDKSRSADHSSDIKQPLVEFPKTEASRNVQNVPKLVAFASKQTRSLCMFSHLRCTMYSA